MANKRRTATPNQLATLNRIGLLVTAIETAGTPILHDTARELLTQAAADGLWTPKYANHADAVARAAQRTQAQHQETQHTPLAPPTQG